MVLVFINTVAVLRFLIAPNYLFLQIRSTTVATGVLCPMDYLYDAGRKTRGPSLAKLLALNARHVRFWLVIGSEWTVA